MSPTFPIDPRSPILTMEKLVFASKIVEYKLRMYYKTVDGYYSHEIGNYDDIEECSAQDFEQAKYYGRTLR